MMGYIVAFFGGAAIGILIMAFCKSLTITKISDENDMLKQQLAEYLKIRIK